MGGVAVVTDSTADLPTDLVESLGLRVVPMSVTFGDQTFISGVTIDRETFYRRLEESERLPTTSQPAPAWFEEAYADCVDDGLDAVVSVHVSSALSGTVALARDRASRAGIPVTVIDSRLVGGPLGLTVLAAHRVAERGGTVEEVVDTVDTVRGRLTSLLVVDSLEHLRRGGRLSGAQALVGSMLQVKPILHLVDGRVEIKERARTFGRALSRVAELVEQAAAGGTVDVSVTHAVAPDHAEELWARIADRVQIDQRLEAVMGPVVGTHVGPGAVAIAVAPSEVTPAG